MSIKKAKKQLKAAFKGTKGVTVSKRKTPKFTEAQKKQIKKAQRQLRSK
jgi:hypothetical protein